MRKNNLNSQKHFANLKLVLFLLVLLVFKVPFIQAQCTILSKGTGITSLSRISWGQSFVPSCSKGINYLVFNSAVAVNSSFTVTIRNGSDCSSSVLYTQSMPEIIDGDNRIDFTTPVNVIGGNTYYFTVESDLNVAWKVRFSSTSQVSGNMKTYLATSDKSACDYNFPNYDWAFSVDTIITPKIFTFPTLGKNVDLFIWGGQSNAQGWQGDGTYYPADNELLDQYIGLNYTYINNTSSSGNWITMQPQEGRFTKGHFGPEVTFGRSLKKAGYNPAIFKYSCGSTSIYAFWKTPGAGGQYDQMVTKVKAAISALEQKGYSVTIRGFVWIQGESDADTEATANAYYASLLSIVRDLRSNVAKNDNLPVILGVDEQHSAVVRYPIIVDSQQRIANEEVNVKFTSMYGLPKADGTHLTPAGLVTHGIRLFDAYVNIEETSGTTDVKVANCKLFVHQDILHVDAQSDCFEVSIFDVIGHLISKKSTQDGSTLFSINKGCYIVKVTINGISETKKIIN